MHTRCSYRYDLITLLILLAFLTLLKETAQQEQQQQQPLPALHFDRGKGNPHHAREGAMHGQMRISRPFELAVVHIPVKSQVASSGVKAADMKSEAHNSTAHR